MSSVCHGGFTDVSSFIVVTSSSVVLPDSMKLSHLDPQTLSDYEYEGIPGTRKFPGPKSALSFINLLDLRVQFIVWLCV